MTGPVDLAGLALGGAGRPVWAHAGDDLNVNLLVLEAGEGVDRHVNAAVEVLVVGVAGEGTVTVDDLAHEVRPGVAVLIPKGAERGVRTGEGRFAYLTCHRRREPLRPVAARR